MVSNIKFRAFKLTDAEFINKLRDDDGMESMVAGTKRFVSIEREIKWIENIITNDNSNFFYVAITLNNDDNIIGYISVADIDYKNGSCRIGGIKIHPSYAGKGVGTQSIFKIANYVFDEMRMTRLQAECIEQNIASIKMFLKVGFQKEGLMRNSLYKNGEYNNQWLLSLLKEDHHKNKPTL